MLRIRLLVAAAAAIGIAAAPTTPAVPSPGPYSLVAVAPLRNERTDVYPTVTSATDPVPDRIEKVQLKALPFEGDHLRTSNYFDLAAPSGAAVVHVDGLERHRPLNVLAHVKEGEQNNVETDAVVRLRPDLAVPAL